MKVKYLTFIMWSFKSFTFTKPKNKIKFYSISQFSFLLLFVQNYVSLCQMDSYYINMIFNSLSFNIFYMQNYHYFNSQILSPLSFRHHQPTLWWGFCCSDDSFNSYLGWLCIGFIGSYSFLSLLVLCCVRVMVAVGDEVVKWRWGVDVVTFGFGTVGVVS
jgi:hypothetical protein